MKKPPTSVRSIRLPDDLWQMIQAQADSIGVSLNRYVAMRLESARRDAAQGARVVAKAAASTEALHFPRAAPGSRLKGAKK
jgi:hypothetical protein